MAIRSFLQTPRPGRALRGPVPRESALVAHCTESSVVTSPRDARCQHQREDAERYHDHQRVAWGCCTEGREPSGDVLRMLGSPSAMFVSPLVMFATVMVFVSSVLSGGPGMAVVLVAVAMTRLARG